MSAGIKGLQDRAIKRLPKLAARIHSGFEAMGIKWGETAPSETDIVSTLTCLIKDLDPERDALKIETGSLFAEYIDADGVQRIEFGMNVCDYVIKN